MHQADRAHHQRVSLERRQRLGARAQHLARRHRGTDGGDQPADELLLARDDAGQIVVQALAPQHAAGLGLGQLDVELEARPAGAIGARQHVVGAEMGPDLAQRGGAAREGGGRQARHHLEVGRLRQAADHLLGQDLANHTLIGRGAARREGHDGDRRRQLVEARHIDRQLRPGRADAIGANQVGEAAYRAVAQVLDVGVKVGESGRRARAVTRRSRPASPGPSSGWRRRHHGPARRWRRQSRRSPPCRCAA